VHINTGAIGGAAGAVLAGFTRDTRGILALDFPVFCSGCYAQDQRGRRQVIAHHVALEIDGVLVRPGDVVFGDIDGVLVIPRELEAEVITGALEKSRHEQTALQDLASGRMATQGFKHYGIF
jgi:regulator of RNase E activity RraA